MQQPSQMIPMMPSYPPTNITTEQIQKYLDENKKLILAILDNQNLGKLAECAQYQAQLQKNLMYLAAIADAQPQAAAMPAQMAPHPAMQPGPFYMQHPQAAAAAMAQAQAQAQHQGLFPQKVPIQFGNPHQLQEHHLQHQLHQHHQQAIQAQMGVRPGGPNNGMQPPHAEAAPPADARGGSKQDGSEAGATGADGHGGADGEEAK